MQIDRFIIFSGGQIIRFIVVYCGAARIYIWL